MIARAIYALRAGWGGFLRDRAMRRLSAGRQMRALNIARTTRT